MKNNKIILVLLFIIAMIIYSIVYFSKPNPDVFIMKPTIEVGVRRTVTFVEEYSPKESIIKVKCESENPLIASIASDRISVTGKFGGTTKVTCTFDGKELGTTEIIVK